MVCSAVSVGAEWRKVRMCAVTRPSAYFAVSSNQNTGLRPRDQSEAGHWSSFPVLWPSVWLWCSVSIVQCLAPSPSSELNKPWSLPGKQWQVCRNLAKSVRKCLWYWSFDSNDLEKIEFLQRVQQWSCFMPSAVLWQHCVFM